MLDPITTGIIIVLGKYALDKGTELGKEMGPKALDTAKEMFTIALDRLRKTPKGKAVAEGYEEDPETYEKPLAKELDKVVIEDADFKDHLESLLKQYDKEAAAHAVAAGTTYTAILEGSGAFAQGERAIAVGERGVNVGGGVQGPIITGSGNVINTGRTAGSATRLPQSLVPLRDNLIQYFNKTELKGLCFTMGVAHDDLPGDTRSELAQALVEHCHERGQLPELLRHCREERPHVDW